MKMGGSWWRRKGDLEMPSQSVGIIYKYHHKPAETQARKLEKWLTQRGVSVYSEEMDVSDAPERSIEERSSIPTTVSWVVVLGGDGTLLGAARKVGRFGVPILGVNLGGLGFLTGIPLNRLYTVVELLLKGKLQVEQRILLEARIVRDGTERYHFQVLNDMVINKGTLARIIDLDVSINGEFLTTFRADGLIVSTPTGSTAYNLSAGGPILYPTMQSFVLTPICPFTLTNRPILLPETAVIEIGLGKESEEQVVLTLDGQVGMAFHYGDVIIIQKSSESIKLFKPPDYSFFNILRTKLKWGGGAHE
jgi:NAD+ kinase